MTIAAVYACTFDPVTLGHADIARRAARAPAGVDPCGRWWC